LLHSRFVKEDICFLLSCNVGHWIKAWSWVLGLLLSSAGLFADGAQKERFCIYETNGTRKKSSLFLHYFPVLSFLAGFEVLTAVVMKGTIFWDITPCSPLSVNRRFGGTYRLLSRWFLAQLIASTLKMETICSSETSVDFQRTTPICFHAGFFLAHFSILKMEAIFSSETLVYFQRTTRRYISDGTLHNHRSENLILHLCQHFGVLFLRSFPVRNVT
jgi:hypothetical protein